MTNHENNGESTPGVLTGYWDRIKDRGPFGRIKRVFGKIAVVLAGTSLALGGAVGCSNERNSTEANSEVSASATAAEPPTQDTGETPKSTPTFGKESPNTVPTTRINEHDPKYVDSNIDPELIPNKSEFTNAPDPQKQLIIAELLEKYGRNPDMDLGRGTYATYDKDGNATIVAVGDVSKGELTIGEHVQKLLDTLELCVRMSKDPNKKISELGLAIAKNTTAEDVVSLEDFIAFENNISIQGQSTQTGRGSSTTEKLYEGNDISGIIGTSPINPGAIDESLSWIIDDEAKFVSVSSNPAYRMVDDTENRKNTKAPITTVVISFTNERGIKNEALLGIELNNYSADDGEVMTRPEFNNLPDFKTDTALWTQIAFWELVPSGGEPGLDPYANGGLTENDKFPSLK